MKKDIKWLKKELKKCLATSLNRDNHYSYGNRDAYNIALSYVDELEKPVIPQFVADWIEGYRKNTLVELINDAVYSSDEGSKCFRRWFHEEMGFESNYSEFLARAWLDGYEVAKKEKGIIYGDSNR